MSIFRRDRPFAAGAPPARRFKIRIDTADGRRLYWHKRGELHTLEEDVADLFVRHFKPELFEVRPDGSLAPRVPGETAPIKGVAKEPA